MTTIYTLPKLKSLRQGARIAFIRQYRQMTLQVFGEKIGMSRKNARTMMTRYEINDRDIKPDRLKKMAQVLNVNIHMIERWNFRDPEQLFYALLWIDELCPNIVIRNCLKGATKNATTEALNKKYDEWRDMRKKYLRKYITYRKYLDWKLGSYTEPEEKQNGKKRYD
ncbi:MAG: helix-turn-helix transcriptional regulator [Butyrivibrio sp.]|nr:helix-turn-helix transcriptional regulator [Butyrivibrio sp.]